MRKKVFLAVVALIAALALPAVVLAQNQMEQNVFLTKDKVIDYNYFNVGQVMSLDATFNKDVYVAAQTLTIDGTIKGDLFCAANDVRINGTVEGNIRCVAQTITINGAVGKNVMVFGTSIMTGPDSKIGWEMLAGGQTVNVQGTIGGNANLSGLVVDVNNEINGWLFTNVEGGQLKLGDKAKINGNLEYTSQKSTALQLDPAARIVGETEFKELKVYRQSAAQRFGEWFNSFLYAFLACLMIAVLLFLLAPKFMESIADLSLEKFGHAILTGLVFMATPIAGVILLITIVGIPLALISMVLFFILLYTGKIFFALTLAKGARKIFKLDKMNSWLMLIGGLAVVVLLTKIPVIGGLFSLFFIMAGVGGLLMALWKALRKV
jgi:cytoskeletal protein CcmA (bactofilin family)